MTFALFKPSFARCGLGLLLVATLPALAAPAETPEGFVRRVYARYRANGPGVLTTRPAGTALYTAALLDAFAKDEDAAHGEVGSIDGDPICGCQDYDLRVKQLRVDPGEADTMVARVDVANLGSRKTIVLTLAQTPAGWRIADVGDKDVKSIVALLKDAASHPAQPSAPASTPPK